MRESRKSNPEKARAIRNKYYTKNREKCLEANRRKYANNREARKSTERKRKADNRDVVLQQKRESYYRNKDVILKKMHEAYAQSTEKQEKQKLKNAEYRKANPASIRLRNRLRKLQLRLCKKDFTDQDWAACLEFWQYRCAVCGRPESDERCIAMDHWKPLTKGGQTSKSNIVPLCHGKSGCNNNKGNKEPHAWLTQKFGDSARDIAQKIEDYLRSV